MTTTAIIGLGNMGKGIAKRLASKTNLVLASRNTDATQAFAQSLQGTPTVMDVQDAIARADVVFLALPFEAALETAKTSSVSGKTLVDISNPVKPDYSGLTIGHTTSAAEAIQEAAQSAKIVKAYNTIFSSIFDLAEEVTAKVPVFLAGNDEGAVSEVEELVKASGFAVEKTGNLDAARLLEPMGMLNIRFGFGLGKGTAIAPTWLSL